MAELTGKAISELPEATSLQNTDLFAISQNATSKKVTTETILRRCVTGFTSKAIVTLPYTFGNSGILVAIVNPSTSSSSAYVIINDGDSYVFSLPSGGASGTFSIPVIKDSTITEVQKNNCTVTYIFCALTLI